MIELNSSDALWALPMLRIAKNSLTLQSNMLSAFSDLCKRWANWHLQHEIDKFEARPLLSSRFSEIDSDLHRHLGLTQPYDIVYNA